MRRISHVGLVKAALTVAIIFMTTVDSIHGQSQCGGSMEAAGIFSSPNYPNSYPLNTYCEWNLTASPGKIVQLQINDFTLASRDAVEVYSGGVLLFWLTFTVNPSSYALSSKVRIVFKSVDVNRQKGFLMSFTSTDAACGRLCFWYFCWLWTPGFPDLYPRSASCSWTVSAGAGGLPQVVEFRAIDSAPFYGRLNFSSTSSGVTTASTVYSSSLPHPSWVGSTLAVDFVSAGCRRRTGFMATVSAANHYCSASLSEQGSQSTPGYPSGYAPLTTCIYALTAAAGKRLNVTLTIATELVFDFVTVFSDGMFYARYTGTYDVFSLTLGSTATLEFYSDGSVSRPGVSFDFNSI